MRAMFLATLRGLRRGLPSMAASNERTVAVLPRLHWRQLLSSGLGALNGLLGGVALAQTQTAPPLNAQLPKLSAVAQGSVNVSQTLQSNAAQMTVLQTTPSAVINWESFNVGQNAQVNFIQPSASSSLLNRILDSNPSQIFGHIKSNGQLFLSNPSGFYFSPTASVDVGALSVTTSSLSDEDFMLGRWTFTRNGAKGAIINEGSLNAAMGSYIALLAPQVRNAGVVVANLGTVAMASGDAITLNVVGGNSLSGITTTPSTIASLISNQLAVKAPGGQILLSAYALNQLQGGVINNAGTLEASSMTAKGGSIVLEANEINLASTSVMNATGPLGGGQILVGGAWQGASDLRPATRVTMQPQAQVDASATVDGDGGTVVLKSDLNNPGSLTSVQGVIKAQGGKNAGHGGQVETSGSQLQVDGAQVSTSAPHGNTGTWLLDPANVTISTDADAAGLNINSSLTPTSGDNFTTINVNTLQNLIAQNNITITTTNDQTAGTSLGTITVASPFSINSGNALTLTSSGQVINTGSTVTLSKGSSLNINAGATSVWSGIITGAGNVGMNMPGNSLFMTANNSYTGTTTITAGTLVLSGSATLAANSPLVNAGTLSLTNKSNINALDLQSWLSAGNVTVTAPSNLNVTVSNSPTLAATSFTGTGNITIDNPISYTSHLLNLSAAASIFINQPIAANYSWVSNAIADATQVAQLQLGYGSSSNYYVNAPVSLGNAGPNFFTLNSPTRTTWVVINALGARSDATTTPAVMTLQGLSGQFSVSSPTQKNFVLGSNIDASATSTWSASPYTWLTGFVPIGYSHTSQGAFFSVPAAIRLDGLGHTIANLSIVTAANLTPTALENVGFISVLGSNGLIRNLGLTNETVQFNGATNDSTKFSVGGLVGTTVGSSTISDTDVSGQVSGKLTYQIGGLVGSSASSISNSYSSALVTLTSVGNYSPASTAAAGGLVGRNILNSVNGTLTTDYASGSVTAPASAFAGSLIGDISNGSVSNSHASGLISTNAGTSFLTPLGVSGSGTASQSSQLSPAQARVQANLTGFDFTNHWVMGPNGPMSTSAPTMLLVEPSVSSVTYGADFPSVSYSLLGLIGPDTSSNVSFSPGAISTTYAAGSNVGSYLYAIAGNVSGQTNFYKVVLDSGSLSVGKSQLYVVPTTGLTNVYGSTPSAVTYSFNTAANAGGSTLLTSDTRLTGLTGVATFNHMPSSASSVGAYPLTYNSGLSSTNYTFNALGSAVAMSVTAAPVTLGGSKTYDGSAIFNAGSLTVAGVNGETLSITAGTATANSKDVGATTAWSSSSGLVLGNGTGLATNYTLANFSMAPITISRLNSVSWVGAATGNWFDPSNWAAGAVPDLSNVSNVLIPANTNVSFGSTVVGAAESGAVNLSSLGNLGSLTMTAGTLNVGSGGVNLASWSQSGGTLNVNGNFTVNSSFTQGLAGSVVVSGSTTLSSNSGVLTLGNLSSTGTLSVSSSAGAIAQASATTLSASSSATLSASLSGQGAGISVSNVGNLFQGQVSLSGSSVSLRNTQALSLGSVSASSDLNLQSVGALSLGATSVGGGLTLNSGGGNITQTAAVSVTGNANLNAGAGSITLTHPGNVFKGSVTTQASSTQIVGLPGDDSPAPPPPEDPPLSNTDLLTMSGVQFSLVSVQQIAQITPTQIPLISPLLIAALTPLQVVNLNTSQIKALTNAQVAALTPNQVASMRPFQIADLNDAQFAFFQPSTLAAFPIATLQALSLTAIGFIPAADLARLSSLQWAAFSVKQLQSLTSLQLSTLSPAQISGWSRAQMAALSATQWRSVAAQTVASLSPDGISNLSALAVQNLSASVFSLLNAAQLNAMNTAQLQALNALQLSQISPFVFQAILPSQLSALTTLQLSGLGPEQISALTALQMSALSKTQFTALATNYVKRYVTANFSSTAILNYLLANPGLSDQQWVANMDQYGVSPADLANAVGVPVAVIQSRYEANGGLVYHSIQTPMIALLPAYWGAGIHYLPQEVESAALNLQSTGASFSEIAASMYSWGITPAQLRNAFLGIHVSQ